MIGTPGDMAVRCLAVSDVLRRVGVFLGDLEALDIPVEFRLETDDDGVKIDIGFDVLPGRAARAGDGFDMTLMAALGQKNSSGDAVPDEGGPKGTPEADGNRGGAPAVPEVRSAAQGGEANDGRSPSEPDGKPAPYTEDDVAAMIRLKREGATDKDIAAELGRTYGSVVMKLSKLRKQGRLETETPAEPAPKPAPVAARSAGEEDVPATAAPASEDRPAETTPTAKNPYRRWAEKQVGLTRDAAWLMTDDLELIEGVTQGRKLDSIAADLERPAEELRTRFRQLCPDPTIERQVALIAVLSDLAGVVA